jgi:TPR repeat protein
MRCLNISRQVLSGLNAIHAAHLIHRDISPDNIMISPGKGGAERATIIDFGIAKEVGGDYTMTESNLFLGKLRYASPEQLKADPNTPVDGRADLYSFGIVLYEMLTGDVPFSAPSAGELIALQLHADPPPLPADVATPALQAVTRRALAKSRDDRFQSAAEFGMALEKAIVQARKPIASPALVDPTARVFIEPAKHKRAAVVVTVAAASIVILLTIIKPQPSIQQRKIVRTDTAKTGTAPVADTAGGRAAATPPAPKRDTVVALQANAMTPKEVFDKGEDYLLGRGVAKNEGEAAIWYRLAALQGYADAQYRLGVMYIGKESWIEGRTWLIKAAEQGNAAAQDYLGGLYEEGGGPNEGSAADQQEAGKWYRKAAEQGYASAMRNLAICLDGGSCSTDGKPDQVSAYQWFLLSKMAGASEENPGVNVDAVLKNLEGSMTTEQLDEAKRRIAEWMTRHPLQTR